jgi:hypothetical protein
MSPKTLSIKPRIISEIDPEHSTRIGYSGFGLGQKLNRRLRLGHTR